MGGAGGVVRVVGVDGVGVVGHLDRVWGFGGKEE